MSWRTVLIQNSAKLSLKNNQLNCEQEGRVNSVPIEDVNVVILESLHITLTTSLLAFLQANNVAVISCDNKHMPNGLMLPFHQHSRIAEVSHLQILWTKPFRKKLWQLIIQQKIINQAECLKLTNSLGEKILMKMLEHMTSGDSKNHEAQAARYYWKFLFGEKFRRESDIYINGCLNYGYSILRSILARSILCSGLLPCFGIHHQNKLNAFNLADDLMEPFRPLVDAQVYEMSKLKPEKHSMTKEEKQYLARIPALKLIISDESHTVINAAEIICNSLVKAMRERNPASIKLPKFL